MWLPQDSIPVHDVICVLRATPQPLCGSVSVNEHCAPCQEVRCLSAFLPFSASFRWEGREFPAPEAFPSDFTNLQRKPRTLPAGIFLID